MYILYFNLINPLYYLLLLCHSAPLLFNSFECFLLHHLPTQMQCIAVLSPIILFSSSSSLLPLQQTQS
jgi:hypothetical protein